MNEPENSVRESISAEEMVLLPLRQFEGEIVIVDTFQETRKAIDYLAKAKVLGFDTETKPTFKKGDSHQVALLQLATQNKAFLFRVMKTGIPDELKKLLADPKILKAGVAIHDDLKALQKIRPFNPGGYIELQNMAKELGIKDFSLKKLCAILLGFRISKSQQLSNWESDELTPPQLAYGATDAWASLVIFEKFQTLLQ